MPVSPQPILAAIVLVSGFGAVVMCLLVLRYGFPQAAKAPGDGWRREMVTRVGHAVAAACFATAAILAVVLVSDAGLRRGEAPHPATHEHVPADPLDAHVASVTARLAAIESRMDAMEARIAPLSGRLAATRDHVAALAAGLERAAAASRLQEIEARLRPLERRVERAEAASVAPTATRAERPRDTIPAPPSSSPPTAATAPSPMVSPLQAPARRPVPPVPSPSPPAATRANAAPDGASSNGGPPRDGEEGGAALAQRMRDDWQTVRRGFADAGDDLKRALGSLRDNLRETLSR